MKTLKFLDIGDCNLQRSCNSSYCDINFSAH
nr:MAG TPA: leucine rich repeat protein [Bacteriophage sp.]